MTSGFTAVIWHGLRDAFLMGWVVWWALVIGFLVSAVIQAWVPRERIEPRALRHRSQSRGHGHRPGGRLLLVLLCRGRDRQKPLSPGAPQPPRCSPSSSPPPTWSGSSGWCCGCSWAGSSRWASTWADVVMIAPMALLLRAFVSPRLEASAREHAEQAVSRSPPPRRRSEPELAPAADQRDGLDRRRAQLPPRLAHALPGDHRRLAPRRICGPATAKLLPLPVFDPFLARWSRPSGAP